MAIRAIIGFDHYPQNVTTWADFADHGITRAADYALQNVITNGWIVSKSLAAGGERVTIPITPYLVAPVGKIWFGVRARIVRNVNSGAGIFYMNGTYQFLVGNIPGVVNGTVAYLEVSYDLTTGVVERWINGVKQTDGSNMGANVRTMTIGLESKGSVDNNIDWRDIYVCDNLGTELGYPIGPLGPQAVVPITLDTATGADWVTTPGGTTLVDAISEPGSVPTAKIATSDVNTRGPLTASLKAILPSTTIVTAIELTAGASSAGAGPTNCSTKLKNGSGEINGGLVQAPVGSYNYSSIIGVFHKCPDGTPWTASNLDATDFILTPDV